MCFGVSLSRWTSDRLEMQNFGEFAKKEGEGKSTWNIARNRGTESAMN